MEKTLFEISRPGRRSFSFPPDDLPELEIEQHVEARFLRDGEDTLPALSELDIVRHYTRLSQMNFSVDTHFYPLGSCTMKYNPKVNDAAAGLRAFSALHPYAPHEYSQGVLSILYELERMLCEICGMDRFTLQPCAGAHGELVGMLIVREYFNRRNELRSKVIVPDSAHGTNPSSAHIAGYEIISVKSDARGHIDTSDLHKQLGPDVACLMLTNPNTLGLFEREIMEIARAVHDAGALLYYDGANLNPLLGIVRPGDMGFDIVHLNLHKTFSTPHGGGGPGAGPVGVKIPLAPYLPAPLIEKRQDRYFWDDVGPESIGRVRAFYGNTGILLRAYCYIKSLGKEGLERTGSAAILNANYLYERIKHLFDTPYSGPFMHEFVISAKRYVQYGVRALDIAKRLLDFGIHAPTVYFPLIVEEAVMIEPTETESRDTLDSMVEALELIARESRDNAALLHEAPVTTPVRRLDEVAAAKELRLVW